MINRPLWTYCASISVSAASDARGSHASELHSWFPGLNQRSARAFAADREVFEVVAADSAAQFAI